VIVIDDETPAKGCCDAPRLNLEGEVRATEPTLPLDAPTEEGSTPEDREANEGPATPACRSPAAAPIVSAVVTPVEPMAATNEEVCSAKRKLLEPNEKQGAKKARASPCASPPPAIPAASAVVTPAVPAQVAPQGTQCPQIDKYEGELAVLLAAEDTKAEEQPDNELGIEEAVQTILSNEVKEAERGALPDIFLPLLARLVQGKRDPMPVLAPDVHTKMQGLLAQKASLQEFVTLEKIRGKIP
ncbi:unnamed protein product, partial [Chrysoparadoxa australica]